MHVFQVATPFSTGTGTYLPGPDLIVTNEHVVRENASVVVGREGVEEQLARVIYLDPYYDLAFLRLNAPLETAPLSIAATLPEVGTEVKAIGQFFGEARRSATGWIMEQERLRNGIPYLVHSGRAGNTLAGSGLYTAKGELVGINMQDDPESEERSLSLPSPLLLAILEAFLEGEGSPGSRCFSCQNITFETDRPSSGRCPHCAAQLTLPSMVEDVAPTGVNATIEEIIRVAGHDPRLARRGPNLWHIRQGSASIQVAYHEDSGLVTGDAYLCQLPEPPSAALFEYLLRENARMRQLSFSTYGRDIILSLLIYDRYLSVDTALPRFEYLFEQADAYDNILVEQYGAGW
ncbi:trypsin-like peptidase domain-containing protein [Neolewinella litorea]|uniref:Serine protease n=1 Tax=Neolewinella litorea TaxID=2562452 RepID=A0A4S4NPU6_9BACT|nr:trypsin-like peptidase domain-containing protein [Neolewinella litorea]THH41962.1 serine protease [Neolewinella litorea]